MTAQVAAAMNLVQTGHHAATSRKRRAREWLRASPQRRANKSACEFRGGNRIAPAHAWSLFSSSCTYEGRAVLSVLAPVELVDSAFASDLRRRRCSPPSPPSDVHTHSMDIAIAQYQPSSSSSLEPPFIMSGAPKCGKCTKTVYDQGERDATAYDRSTGAERFCSRAIAMLLDTRLVLIVCLLMYV
jgi:hypothetical protein